MAIAAAGCAKDSTDGMKVDDMDGMQSGDMQFKKMCQDAGYEWMLMKPTKDGKIIQNAQTCMGCMVEEIEHICDMDKFMEITGMQANK